MNPHEVKFKGVRNMEGIEDSEDFLELLESIREHGVLVPIQVYIQNGETFAKAGHRRVIAARILDLDSVPHTVVDPPSDQDRILHQLAMNMLQAKLNPIDLAHAFAKVINVHGASQDSIAKSIGKSTGYVSQHIGLLRLPEDLQERIRNGSMSYRAGYTISTLFSSEMGLDELRSIKTVREAKTRKRSIEGRRAIVKQVPLADLEIPENLSEEQPGEQESLVLSLFQMAIDTIKRAVEMATEHDIKLNNQSVLLKEAISE